MNEEVDGLGSGFQVSSKNIDSNNYVKNSGGRGGEEASTPDMFNIISGSLPKDNKLDVAKSANIDPQMNTSWQVAARQDQSRPLQSAEFKNLQDMMGSQNHVNSVNQQDMAERASSNINADQFSRMSNL